MQPKLAIRDATDDDAMVIADIYNESILAGDATMDDEPKSEEDIRLRIRDFDDNETILVLESDGDVIGWGIIKKYSNRRGYRYACETAVYLRRNLIGKGLGSKLKAALINRCREYGYHHLVAKIFADNRASIAYNTKFGYEIVGRQKEIGFKHGKWQDVVIMQLVLPDVTPHDLKDPSGHEDEIVKQQNESR